MKTARLSHKLNWIYNRTSLYTHKYDTEWPSTYQCTAVE